MGKAKKALYILGIVVFVIVVAIAAGFYGILNKKTPVDHEILNADAQSKKLAIVTDGSEYKAALKAALAEALGADCCIEVFGLQDARKVNTEDYDLVVVMAPVYIGRLQTSAKNFVVKNEDSGNLMLIITAEGTNDIDMGVDTVTMATTAEFSDAPTNPMYTAEEAAQMIVDKLG